MNNINNVFDANKSNEISKKHIKRVRRQEKYLFIERDKSRRVSYNDAIMADKNADVIDTISRNNQHKALMFALTKLNSKEKQIIDECFFEEKRSFAELSKLHNISKPAYWRKLQRILLKLRGIIVSYAEITDFWKIFSKIRVTKADFYGYIYRGAYVTL